MILKDNIIRLLAMRMILVTRMIVIMTLHCSFVFRRGHMHGTGVIFVRLEALYA